MRRSASPVGVDRLVWSYLAVLVGLLPTGFGLAIGDTLHQGVCGESDALCAVGVVLVSVLIGAVVGALASAWLLRLGGEWAAVVSASIVAMPPLLDALGAAAWGLLALSPALAAGLTWRGPAGPRWRRWAIALGSLAVVVVVVAVVFILPGQA